ncbi:uncharacterized protein LOC111698261 [Eurytemora carolleeae]|uniref:uncharacterized protein LOC111698261 n=1 Tax=Eurytemora carolleeae TaxID=1294199 RepID=UPI000C756677|nr:uncharacterized protein LOC111698261 [Eurytemora carolleeae]|eukprot:XP_023324317.1 uncharacterized protein LOC111698261 [Eurytemora affinis]
MSGLCFNYNIQGMKLLHELKALFPSITDDAVKACMKKNNNHKERCKEELRIELESSLQGRYRSRHRLKLSQRRYSAGTLSGDPYRTGENKKMRRSSVCDSQTGSSTSSWATVLAPLDQNIQVVEPKTDWSVPNKRCYESTNLSLPRKVMRCEERRDPVTLQHLKNYDVVPQEREKEKNIPQEREQEKNIPQDREQEKNTNLIENGVPQGSIVGTRIKKPIPRPLSLAQFADIETIPTVVLTPESPPKDSGNHRRIETLYSPDSVNSHLIQNETDLVPELPELALSMADDESMILCGKNTTVTKTCIDLIPEHSALVLPFGNTSIKTTLATEPGTVVTKSSLSTGTLHFLKDSGDGTISIATTSFCGFQRTVVTNSLGCDAPKSSAKSTTVLYTVNSKPVICENPFRKVFAKRKQFYQAKENRDSTSPETSSKKLLWRPCNHACRRNSLCPDNRPADPPSPRYFTLNANIQPFDAFTIRHHLNSEGENNPSTTAVNLSMNSDSGFPVQLLPDAQGIMYQTKVDIPEEGAEAHLEVKVQKDGSLITTKRTGSSDCTSNEISVQLLDGGSRVSIQQSQITLPLNDTKSVRPTSLHIPGSKYATVRPQSLYQGRGTSPSSVPRYNSLPNLKGFAPEGITGGGGWSYQSHPRDEEKRIAYTRALLSHQLEQKFKLESSLRAEQGEVNHLRHEVYELELRWKRISLKSQPIIAVTLKIKTKGMDSFE